MSERMFIDAMRGRLGLDGEDASRDDEIEKMSPMERLKLICGWHLGDPNWASTLVAWAKDAGFTIEQNNDAKVD